MTGAGGAEAGPDDAGGGSTGRALRVLITAGPTREPLDPVRFLSNRSSGRMGYALAAAACAMGHEVTLVSGPVAIQPPACRHVVGVETAAEMHAAVADICRGDTPPDMAIMAAAVADFRPVSAAKRKIKKTAIDQSALRIELEPTEDILAGMRSSFGFRGLLVGFAAETDDLTAHAFDKLRRKRCDLVVANPVGPAADGTGFDSEDNVLTLCHADGRTEAWQRDTKERLAVRLMELCTRLARKKLDNP